MWKEITEQNYDEVNSRIDDLMNTKQSDFSKDKSDELDLLFDMVYKYDEEHYIK